MVELIIAEKPSAAKKIAEALADKTPKKTLYKKKIPYYELDHKGHKIIVVSAVGHLYTVAEREKKGWTYPIFDVVWKATYEVDKHADYTKDYLDLIKKLCKGITKYTVATDYDIEGEVIGLNIIKFACKQKDARRMKYSTTTKEDLRKSYENVEKHLDWLQAEAGLTRHELDYYYGINLSRALTLAIKASGSFKIMSSGRVQGPALELLTEREKEIKKFKSKPFWLIELLSKELTAWHKKDKFWDKKEANKIMKKTKGKDAIVDKITKKKYMQEPPFPFDLTALQLEAYRQHGIQPKKTLELAQKLYTDSYISYPRTSSNQLPPAIGYRKLIQKLSKQKEYLHDCVDLLEKKDLVPNNGKKTDAAHPACHPTGEVPKRMGEDVKKLYNLIVRRTLASFGDSAERETITVNLDVNKEIFVAKGTRTTIPGWHRLYGKYAKFEEQEMPKLSEGAKIKVKKIILHEKETQPPKRYTPASIISELEKRGLGTKATRAHIIDSLVQRNYVTGKSLEVTDLGMKTVSTLKKYCPEILDQELTREFEEDMEKIREKKTTQDKILNAAKKVLTKVLKTFKENEVKIGKALSKANRETQLTESLVGPCDKCKEGNLRIKYSPRFKSRFIACDAYPKCRNTFSLPMGLPKTSDKKCPECKYPMVMIIRAGKRPFFYCINKQCPKKLEWMKEQEKKKAELDKADKKAKKKTVKKKVKKKTVKKKA